MIKRILIIFGLLFSIAIAEDIDKRVAPAALSFFTRALIAELRGNYDEAYYFYTEAEKIYPEDTEIKKSIANVLFLKKDYDKSASQYKKLIQRYPNNIDYRRGYANALFELAKYKPAIDEYERILSDVPDDYQTRINLALCYSSLGEYKKAIGEIEKGIEIDPENSNLFYFGGEISAKAKKYADAIKYFRAAIEKEKYFNDPYFGLAYSYRMLGLTDSSRMVYENFIELNLNEVDYFWVENVRNWANDTILYEASKSFLKKNPTKANAYKMAIYMAFALKDYASSTAFMNALFDLVPDDIDMRLYFAFILYSEARDVESLMQLRKILQIDKDNALAFDMFIELLNATDSVETALQIAKEAQISFGDNARLFFTIGVLFSRLGKKDSAAVFFEKAASLEPENEEYLFLLSDALMEMGEIDSSIAILKILVEDYPENDIYLNYLGYLLADANRELELAETLIRKALSIDPENAAYIDSYGWLLFRLGNYKDALTELKKAEKLSETPDPTILEHIGEAYEKLGEVESAKKYYKKAIELNPKMKTSQERLNKLK